MDYGFSKALYPGQKKLIEDASYAIDNNKFAIISSPTGTGKTLSLLCTASKYLSKPKSEDANLFDLLNSKESTKIYYCSRTHSQLSQVINELKECKTKINSVVIGSRKVYCVNPEVNKLKDIDSINDKCKSLIKNDCCSFYKNGYYSSVSMDIEELKTAAMKECFCPYYHSKNKASDCEIVFLPYNLLFTTEGRSSLNISLKDKILIIDEAHNIYDTVIQLNSAETSWNDLKSISCAKGLSDDLKSIILKIQNYKLTAKLPLVKDVVTFLIECKISNFNMLEISDVIEKTRLAQKNDMKCIFEFSKFLKYLTFSDQFGKIFIDQNKIKFATVNPKMYFQDLKECKSVIFAGGTMEPIAQLKNVFPEILYFNYPAVNTNFLSLIIPETANGKTINLNFSQRDQQVDDVLNTIVALSNPVLTGGIIVFVPSNQILQMVKSSSKINNFRRKVYFEGNMTFDQFKNSPDILFAVMGGTLSEGINFSDDLCRLLIVMGVPFPSKNFEIEEKAKFFKDYEILVAMKTVNQTVGRALRHKNDYAAIVFLDSRFVQLKANLSPWLLPKTQICKFGEGICKMNTFLKSQINNLI